MVRQTPRQRRLATEGLHVTRIDVFGKGQYPRIDGVEVSCEITMQRDDGQPDRIFLDGQRVLHPAKLYSSGNPIAYDPGQIQDMRP